MPDAMQWLLDVGAAADAALPHQVGAVGRCSRRRSRTEGTCSRGAALRRSHGASVANQLRGKSIYPEGGPIN
eukprot:4611118-Pyramimonas_sp.AAC.1